MTSKQFTQYSGDSSWDKRLKLEHMRGTPQATGAWNQGKNRPYAWHNPTTPGEAGNPMLTGSSNYMADLSPGSTALSQVQFGGK